jgi:REP element-mobilizing transposase RayT
MGHSHCSHLYHIVYSTKYRTPWLTPNVDERIYQYLGGIVHHEGGTSVIVNGYRDHVHVLAWLRQDRAVSDVVRILKAKSSGWIHRTFPELAEFAWQTGYGSFTVSRGHLEKVCRYIERQETHHRQQTFETEFIELLDAHHLPYDPTTLWD